MINLTPTSSDCNIVYSHPHRNVILSQFEQRFEHLCSALELIWRLQKFGTIWVIVFRGTNIEAFILIGRVRR